MKSMLFVLTLSVFSSGCAALEKAGSDFVQAERDGWADLRCQRTPGCAPPAMVPRARSGPVRPYEYYPSQCGYGCGCHEAGHY